MDHKLLSTGIPHKTLPDNYTRPESQRPNLSQVSDCEDVPVINLAAEDHSQILQQVSHACTHYGFFQVTFFSDAIMYACGARTKYIYILLLSTMS